MFSPNFQRWSKPFQDNILKEPSGDSPILRNFQASQSRKRSGDMKITQVSIGMTSEICLHCKKMDFAVPPLACIMIAREIVTEILKFS